VNKKFQGRIGAGYDAKAPTILTANIGSPQRVETLEGRTRMPPTTGASIFRSSASDSFKRYEFGFSLNWDLDRWDSPWHSTLLAWPEEKDASGASK
jgi:hypothetical protein